MGIRVQLLLPLLVLLAGMVAMCAQMIEANLAVQTQDRERRMDQLAKSVSEVAIPKTPTILNLMKAMSGADLALCDGQGKTLVTENGEVLGTLPGTPRQFVLGESELAQGGDVREIDQEVYHARRVPWGARPEDAPYLFILFAKPPWREVIWKAVQPVILPALSGCVIAFALALLLSNRLTIRFRQIGEQTKRIAAGDFAPLEVPRGSGEIRELCLSINRMAAQLLDFREQTRLDERLKLLGQVSAGLAHQLRNTTAGARLAVQLHAKTCPQANREDLDVALRQLQLSETQVKRLLDLGQVQPIRAETFDLGQLVAEWIALLGPQCRHSRIELLAAKPHEPVEIQGDRDQIGDALHNLLINAMEAAGPGGMVEVRSGVDADGAYVEVIDTGAGPSAQIASRLFDPFATTKREGVGLGLAVARQVARSHGGDVIWKRVQNRTAFKLSLARGTLARKSPQSASSALAGQEPVPNPTMPT